MELKRRKFIVVTTLAAGFALSVEPIFAQALATDAKGLVAGEVKISVADGEIPAYRAIPQLLKAGSSGSEIISYPDTPHGFFADYRPSYRKPQAEDGWKRLQTWFKQHGVA